MNPNIEKDLEDSLAELDATRQKETSQTWVQQAEKTLGTAIGGLTSTNKGGEPGGAALWIAKLPRNVSVGLIDAAVNTADAMKSFVGAAADSWKAPGQISAEGGAKASGQTEPEEAAPPEPDSPVYSAAKREVQSFRNYLAQGSETSDEITQAISQYAIPFLGWSKLVGGLQGASTAGTIARAGVTEALTAATVLAPHDPRAADILQLGKHVEGKFGDAMNAIAPDGSLLNEYINYMADRENESEAEGRFKNVVDNLALTAAAAGLIKVTAMTMKGGFATMRYAMENAGTGAAFGPSKQRGQIVFHGTPYDFDKFDSAKIGAGEGNQSFGHGLYFAENPATAGTYQQKLSGVKSGTPLSEAIAFVNDAGGDEVKAYREAMSQAQRMSDPSLQQRFTKVAEMIKAGNAKPRGTLLEVHVPDEQVAKMLLWDKPLSEQPAGVVDALTKATGMKFDSPDSLAMTGERVHNLLASTMSSTEISAKLNAAGIPGIRYLDQGSRNAGEGTHNIVLFDPKDATILKKNDKPVIPERRKEINKQMRAKAELAPAKGAAVVQTGKDQYTIFVDRKPQGSYQTEARANEELDALMEKK